MSVVPSIESPSASNPASPFGGEGALEGGESSQEAKEDAMLSRGTAHCSNLAGSVVEVQLTAS